MENCTSPVLVSEMRSKSAQQGPGSGEKKKGKQIMTAAFHESNQNRLALE